MQLDNIMHVSAKQHSGIHLCGLLLSCTGFKSYHGKTEIGPLGSFCCVIGPNGCGKSVVVSQSSGTCADEQQDATHFFWTGMKQINSAPYPPV